MSITALVTIMITSLFSNNVVFKQTLGICPYLGVSRKSDTAVGMGLAVTFVLTVAYCLLYLLNTFVLVALGVEYLQLLLFILIIAAVVQLMEVVLKRFLPALHKGMGVFLPLIATNCAILGTLNRVYLEYTGFLPGLVYSVFVGLGFLLALVLMSGIRERLARNESIPKSFQGLPVALFTAAIIGLAFVGLGGINFFG